MLRGEEACPARDSISRNLQESHRLEDGAPSPGAGLSCALRL